MSKSLKLSFDLNSVVEEFRNSILDTTELPNRPKLTIDTDNYFTEKLNETGLVYCVLRSRGNQTKKTGSRKTKSPIFNGKFHCLHNNCHIKFRITLDNLIDRFFNVSWTDIECNHGLIKPKEKITGEKREEISLDSYIRRVKID